MFRDPFWFLALLAPLSFVFLEKRPRPALRFPAKQGLQAAAQQSGAWQLSIPWMLRAAALALVVVSLARFQQGLKVSPVTTEGVDISLAVDVSTSMLAEDFTLNGSRRNRLEVVKEVVKKFIEARPNDRIGLVVFAGRAYTQCPLTLDHGWLLGQLDRAQIGEVEDGTAIGSGIATGLNRLRHSKAKSRVMVLLTDGVNNAGSISPDSAAQLAKALHVKIYCIGAGTKGLAPYPAVDPLGRKVYQDVKIEVDDEGLTKIADATGGKYFRATDTASLQKIYGEINQMEKASLSQPVFLAYKEWYGWFLIPAMLLLVLESALAETRLRVLP